jgi:hypothetical protein
MALLFRDALIQAAEYGQQLGVTYHYSVVSVISLRGFPETTDKKIIIN